MSVDSKRTKKSKQSPNEIKIQSTDTVSAGVQAAHKAIAKVLRTYKRGPDYKWLIYGRIINSLFQHFYRMNLLEADKRLAEGAEKLK